MRSNERLQRALTVRHLGGGHSAACSVDRPAPNLLGDVRLFALTFAGGFLFTSIFIA